VRRRGAARAERGGFLREGKMAIVRWDPFRELTSIQERMNRLFGDVYRRADDELLTGGTWAPPVDIYENDNHELVLKAEIPGMKREDIQLAIDNNTLTLRGEKKIEQGAADERSHRIERSYGAFARTFSLPATIDATKVSAEYTNGVLTVTLPLREEAKPTQIDVAIGG
jgi:HSP20 family protein